MYKDKEQLSNYQRLLFLLAPIFIIMVLYNARHSVR